MSMLKKVYKSAIACALGTGLLLGSAHAAEFEMQRVDGLDQLLNLVRERTLFESEVNREREREFVQRRDRQDQMLTDAKNDRTREEDRSERLEATFQENERLIGQLQEQLDARLGTLREMFGVLQQVAGDTVSVFNGSIVSAQYPGRADEIQTLARRMGESSRLASIEEIEGLWIALQEQMTESGKVVRFPGTVIEVDGERTETSIIRVGDFNLIAGGQYVNYNPDNQAILALARQPSGRFTSTAAGLERASAGEIVPFALDPTRGSLLSLLIQGKTIEERVHDGGPVGYTIISLGIIGVLIAIWRFIDLMLISQKVASQRKSPEEPNTNNPLGRVLKVYSNNKDVGVETLELKLGEAILGETPKLSRGLGLVQVISVVSPLMGLLGTVIGMILTFQAITLFGTGDPQTMAGGISTALMTTVLGLVVAIPTVLLHAILSTRAKSIVHVLEEQSAGLIAEAAERSGRSLG